MCEPWVLEELIMRRPWPASLSLTLLYELAAVVSPGSTACGVKSPRHYGCTKVKLLPK
jgi:hypothetical protein